jgi:hypothetical protein
MTFLHPLGLLALAAVPALIVLSLWRWRRREMSVASLLLWREVAALARRAPRSQRRRLLDPLVALRVAVALAVAAALCAPVWLHRVPLVRRVVIVADRSASMATRQPDGRTRWEVCREELLSLLGRLGASDRASIVAVPEPTDQRIPPELAPDEAIALLRQMAPSEEPVEPPELVAAVTAAARSQPDARVVLATDEPPQGLPNGVGVLAVGGPTRNRGIVAFAARRRPDGKLEVLVGVANAAVGPASVEIDLLADGREVGRQMVDVPALGRGQAIFEGDLDKATVLEARLAGSDELAVDDRAWLARRSRPLRIALVGNTNYYLRRALAVQPAVEVVDFAEPPEGSARQDWDLLVCYRDVPKQLAGQIVLVAPAKPVGGIALGEPIRVGEPAVVARGDPLMESVDLAGVQAGPVRPVATPEGFATLARAGQVPLIGRWHAGGATLIYVGIDPAESDWTRSVSFPVFWANVVAACSGQAAGSGGFATVRPGDVVRLGIGEAGATLIEPDGTRRRVTGGVVRPEKVGVYTVEADRGRTERLAVGLLSATETLATGTTVPLPPGFLQGAVGGETTSTLYLSQWLALAGIGLILAHTWLANRGR